MSMVNADVTELLQSWNNIKTAISSIETTRTTMTRKYQQLSGEWKDRKFTVMWFGRRFQTVTA